MAINIHSHQVPQLITWFNGYIGFRELWGRLNRVESKLKTQHFESPILARRYFFHTNYKRLIIRNRTTQRFDVSQFENYQPLNFIAAVRDARRSLSSSEQSKLRSKILDGLSPDRDIRELEHEFRVYTHYAMNGCNVAFADLEGGENHDFRVEKDGTTFEVEAKSLSEDIGNLLTAEQSLVYFDSFRQALERTPSFRESGILTYQLEGRPPNSGLPHVVLSHFLDFLIRGIATKNYEGAQLTFNRKHHWDDFIRQQDFGPIRQEFFRHQEAINPHAMLILGHGRAVLLCISGNRPARLLKGVMDRLKRASGQLSGSKPGVIWAHFLGLNEAEFRSLSADHTQGRNGAFGAFGRYVFGSDKRNHVCRLRLSADSDLVSRRKSAILTPHLSNALSVAGPAYDLVSNVSRYDPQNTF